MKLMLQWRDHLQTPVNQIGHVALVVVTGTAIYPNALSLNQITATYLKIGKQ